VADEPPRTPSAEELAARWPAGSTRRWPPPRRPPPRSAPRRPPTARRAPARSAPPPSATPSAARPRRARGRAVPRGRPPAGRGLRRGRARRISAVADRCWPTPRRSPTAPSAPAGCGRGSTAWSTRWPRRGGDRRRGRARADRAAGRPRADRRGERLTTRPHAVPDLAPDPEPEPDPEPDPPAAAPPPAPLPATTPATTCARSPTRCRGARARRPRRAGAAPRATTGAARTRRRVRWSFDERSHQPRQPNPWNTSAGRSYPSWIRPRPAALAAYSASSARERSAVAGSSPFPAHQARGDPDLLRRTHPRGAG